MHNTAGDVALMNINRETNCFPDVVQCPKQEFFAFPASASGMFLEYCYILDVLLSLLRPIYKVQLLPTTVARNSLTTYIQHELFLANQT